jgi:hypothetical protein
VRLVRGGGGTIGFFEGVGLIGIWNPSFGNVLLVTSSIMNMRYGANPQVFWGSLICP